LLHLLHLLELCLLWVLPGDGGHPLKLRECLAVLRILRVLRVSAAGYLAMKLLLVLLAQRPLQGRWARVGSLKLWVLMRRLALAGLL
jgi:hypothetical protein